MDFLPQGKNPNPVMPNSGRLTEASRIIASSPAKVGPTRQVAPRKKLLNLHNVSFSERS